ncbi:MAG: hypothetical protein HY832_02850 [Candidatus Aenigmarchaeota archaeon]|nr:hypothetical protein [Candidatus Aenigmarchaeota archaeon]
MKNALCMITLLVVLAAVPVFAEQYADEADATPKIDLAVESVLLVPNPTYLGSATGIFITLKNVGQQPLEMKKIWLRVAFGDRSATTEGLRNGTLLPNQSVQIKKSHLYTTIGNFTVSVLALYPVDFRISNNRMQKILAVIPSPENTPPIIFVKSVPENVTVGENSSFSFVAIDAENDTIAYSLTWGDGIGETEACSPDQCPHKSGDLVTFNHTWTTPGTYTVVIQAHDVHGAMSSNIPLLVIVTEQPVNTPPVIIAGSFPTSLYVGQNGTFSFTAVDAENDTIAYSITWGDGIGEAEPCVANTTDPEGRAICPHRSGDEAKFIHAWSNIGTYLVMVSVRDHHNAVASPENFTVYVVEQPRTADIEVTNLSISINRGVNSTFANVTYFYVVNNHANMLVNVTTTEEISTPTGGWGNAACCSVIQPYGTIQMKNNFLATQNGLYNILVRAEHYGVQDPNPQNNQLNTSFVMNINSQLKQRKNS